MPSVPASTAYEGIPFTHFDIPFAAIVGGTIRDQLYQLK
jgi:hypothetical protein